MVSEDLEDFKSRLIISKPCRQGWLQKQERKGRSDKWKLLSVINVKPLKLAMIRILFTFKAE